MKKVGKIIIVILSLSFIISIASTIYLISNKDKISSDINKLNEQASEFLDEVTNTTNSTDKEPTTSTESNTTTTEKTTDESELFNSYIGNPLENLIKEISKTSYNATYLSDGVDFTGFIESMQDLYIVGDLTVNTEEKTIIVDLISKSSIKADKQTEALKKRLNPYNAWVAVEEYGIEQYSDFELNYIVGKIAEELEDENTWFLKASCSVLGAEKTCEAKVTGTTDNPKVIDFIVY